MRCYKVTGPNNILRYAATSAEARSAKQSLTEEFQLKRKDVVVEKTDIPLKKDELLKFINNLAKRRG